MTSDSHWENLYRRQPAESVSWFQSHAQQSLELIRRIVGARHANVIDVGGGASTLVDDLLEQSNLSVTVLDIAATALEVSRTRLGARASRVRWIVGDITKVELPEQNFDIWHDRAVFHFLTDPNDRAAYVQQVRRAVRPGGHVIVAAFGSDGPTQCSGLPVVRYQADALHAEFGARFELVEHLTELHHTPAGKIQQFVYCHCVMR